MTGHILVIDQGTTSTRAIVFGPDATPIATGQQEFRQIFPQPGWVEHDPEDIWLPARRERVGVQVCPGSEGAYIE